jgi:hypothetical protein
MELILLILVCGLIYRWREPSWMKQTISAEEYEALCKKYGRPKSIPGVHKVREFDDSFIDGA